MKLSQLAETLACRLEGDPQLEITGIAGIEHAQPGQLTFLANRRYAPQLKSTRASAVFIEERVNLTRDPDAPPLAALRTPNPYLAFAKAPSRSSTSRQPTNPESTPPPSSPELPASARHAHIGRVLLRRRPRRNRRARARTSTRL
jgi:UDP-3-O-[3-hydroxymyristoyl] glucosamine N-acyltransferase